MESPPCNAEPFAYSVLTAAALVGIGKSKLYEEIAAGRIRTIAVGTRRLITRSALEEYLAKLEGEAAAR